MSLFKIEMVWHSDSHALGYQKVPLVPRSAFCGRRFVALGHLLVNSLGNESCIKSIFLLWILTRLQKKVYELIFLSVNKLTITITRAERKKAGMSS